MKSKILLNNEKIKELAKSMKCEEKSFVNYFSIFQALYDTEESTSFANYFHEVCLFELESINQINNEDSFIKSIASFINEVTYDKKRIYFELSDEKSIKKVIEVLKLLKTPKKYIYSIKIAKPKKGVRVPKMDIDFNKYKEIFDYLDQIEDPKFFNDFVIKAIEEEIDVPKLFYVNLDKIPNDKVIKYSTKYPNRIRELYAFSNKNYDEIKKICELNSESLIRCPNCKLDLYTNLKNIEIITVNSEPLPNPLPNNFNYEKIKNLETIFIDYEKEESFNVALELINRCPNVEEVSFTALEKEKFFEILSKTTSKKIRRIYATVEDLEEEEDFSPIFANLPNLSKWGIELHASMEYNFGLLPVFNCERVTMPQPFLEILLRNYIQEDESNFFSCDFNCYFEEFYDYFKDKEDILKRIDSFTGENYINYSIPFQNNLTLRKGMSLQNCISKHICTFNVIPPLNEEIKSFIQKVKPTFIKIKEGELEKIDGVRIIYNLAKEEMIIN